MFYGQAGSGWSRFHLIAIDRGTRMNRIDRVLAFIESASLVYYARAVEGCAALTMIGLAGYVSDERVVATRLVMAPQGVPVYIASFILIAVGVVQLVGITMPLVYDLFKHCGFKSRWLTNVRAHEKTWRICAMVADIVLLGAYAGLMSAGNWGAWLSAGGLCLLLTFSIFRLGAMMDADRAGPTRDIAGDDNREPDDPGARSDSDHLEVAQPPPGQAALGFSGNISN